MSTLLQLQNDFQHFILSDNTSISDSIVETETVSIATRLAIYHDAYRLRLIESLTNTFPALYAYLGTEKFNEMCHHYIRAYPSVYRSIRWYGHAVAEFLKNHYPTSGVYLAELADFEWKMTLAFDATDAVVISINDMAQVAPDAWGAMQFIVHPSMQRINYFWNVIPLWQNLIADSELPPISKNTNAVAWVMWRTPDYQIHFYSMSEEESWMLDGIAQGLTFGELCEGLCQWIDVAAVSMSAASYLKNWIQNGMLSQLILA